MTLIKIKLVRFEKAVAMQILEQDEAQRPTEGSSGFRFTAKNKFQIAAGVVPELNLRQFFIRGTRRSADMNVETLHFNSNEDRDVYIDKLLAALEDWSVRGGFHPKPEAPKVGLGPDEYEF